MTNTDTHELQLAPGEIVVVRDAEWLVTNTERTSSGTLVRCLGLSELVRDTSAAFYSSLDEITPLNPSEAKVVADDSSQYRTSRLWLESALRRQPIPMGEQRLTVSKRMLADPLDYQLKAVERAFAPEQLRPRLLIADAVGLGKTIEIGMILSELVRRGHGERMLIVTPKHVLEQMQRELWTRFALPFVRLDSVGLQRVRQQLPATRNPFSYFKRAIISIDTLKQEQYRAHLEKFRWDAVVIDESHNITGATLNNRLARTLAPNTHALILASATPHNGRAESFAELIRLLEPTAVTPTGELDRDAVARLVLRRHRHSPEVQREVGADWAERKEPQHLRVPANNAENRLADELASVWLHPETTSPYSGENKGLFPWTLAKAFLSSPVALLETVRERRKRLDQQDKNAVIVDQARSRERTALDELERLGEAADQEGSAKLEQLTQYLKLIGVGRGKPERVVIFSERVATLNWLKAELQTRFKLKDDEIAVLHGQLSDEEQQRVVEQFRQASSNLRVLVTGDVASEGVNLHSQCHELVHFDIPWSLIRIEQRNGRIDRYGQHTPPQITTLLLDFENDTFDGDMRVLARLVDREHEAHHALGDTASLMGKYDTRDEEDQIRRVLAGTKTFDEVVRTPEEVLAGGDGGMDAFLALVTGTGVAPTSESGPEPAQPSATTAEPSGFGVVPAPGLFADQADFLRTGLAETYPVPTDSLERNGVGLTDDTKNFTISVTPPRDLTQRLRVLPQSYLAERKVTERLTVTTARGVAKQSLSEAQNSMTSRSLWPSEHYLGPLHPMLDWIADRTLTSLGRNEVFAVRGAVDYPTAYLLATISDGQARTVASLHVTQTQPGEDPGLLFAEVHQDAHAALSALGLTAENRLVNPGPVDTAALQALIPAAVAETRTLAENQLAGVGKAIERRVTSWHDRVDRWLQEAGLLVTSRSLRERKSGISEEAQIAESMRPQHLSVRPLLVVVPNDTPVARTEHLQEPQHREGAL